MSLSIGEVLVAVINMEGIGMKIFGIGNMQLGIFLFANSSNLFHDLRLLMH